MNLHGLTLNEKLNFWLNRAKYNFKEIKAFSSKDITVKDNTAFTGTHNGTVNVNSNVCFIHRGEIIGDLIISDTSKVIVFGTVVGDIKCENELDLRKGSVIKGNIYARKLKLGRKIEFIGKIHLI